jgi:hypothetical protein
MEPEGSLPHSQEPATCPYPESTSLYYSVYRWWTYLYISCMDIGLLPFGLSFTILNTTRDIKQVPRKYKRIRDSKLNALIRLRTEQPANRGSIPGKDNHPDKYQCLIYPGLKRPGC